MDNNNVKVYKYRTLKYFLSSLGPVLVIIYFLILGIIGKMRDPGNDLYSALVGVLPFLLFFEIIGLNQPGKITDDGEFISFYAFGREHHFKWNAINYLNIKRFPLTSKIYLRIGSNNVLKGRYWLFPKQLNNGEELMEKLYALDKKLNPVEATPKKQAKKTKLIKE